MGGLEGARKPARVNGERGRADDDNGPMHLPSGKGSELWFVEKDGQVDVSGLDSPSDCERSQGPILEASDTDGGYSLTTKMAVIYITSSCCALRCAEQQT